MQYKTIALELLKQLPPNPLSSDSLHSRMGQVAVQLRDRHLAIVEQLKQTDPTQSDIQLKAQAMELAIDEIRGELEGSQ